MWGEELSKGCSKLYQQRLEMMAELRKELDPWEDLEHNYGKGALFNNQRTAMLKSQLNFVGDHLPPLNKNDEAREGCQARPSKGAKRGHSDVEDRADKHQEAQDDSWQREFKQRFMYSKARGLISREAANQARLNGDGASSPSVDPVEEARRAALRQQYRQQKKAAIEKKREQEARAARWREHVKQQEERERQAKEQQEAKHREAARRCAQQQEAEKKRAHQQEAQRRRAQQQEAVPPGAQPPPKNAPAPPSEPYRERHGTRHNFAKGTRNVHSDGNLRESPKAAAYVKREVFGRSCSLPSVRPAHRPAEDSRKAAEEKVSEQLSRLRALPMNERKKAFKDLLRVWHPDKNLQNHAVATAVFQRIQAERASLFAS